MVDDTGGVGVGGDGSVAWRVWAGHVRKGTVVSRATSDYGYLQEGVDEADYGQSFEISLKVPREDGEKLAAALYEAAKQAEAHCKDPGHRITFPLVLEPKNPDQILITWRSAAHPPKAVRPPKKKRGKASGKARPSAKTSAKKSKGKPTGKKKAGKKR